MAEIKTYKNNKFSIRYAVIGNGAKALIMIPGISLKAVVDSADSIESAFSMFLKEYTIYLIDRRDNIEEYIEQGFTVENMARDIIELLDFLKINKACFFGASQGGMIIEKIAKDRPDIIEKAVFASSAIYTDDAHKKVFASWVEKGKDGDIEKLNRDMWDKVYDKDYLDKYKEVFDGMVLDGSLNEMKKVSVLSKACIDFDARSYIDKVNCKALIVGGVLDKVFGVEASKELAKALKGDIYIYENYGHALYDEAPDFKERMYNFFSK